MYNFSGEIVFIQEHISTHRWSKKDGTQLIPTSSPKLYMYMIFCHLVLLCISRSVANTVNFLKHKSTTRKNLVAFKIKVTHFLGLQYNNLFHSPNHSSYICSLEMIIMFPPPGTSLLYLQHTSLYLCFSDSYSLVNLSLHSSKTTPKLHQTKF